MRKRVKMMVAAAVCAVTMFVVGCGNADKQTVSDAPAAAEAVDSSVDSTQKFIGDWKLAYIESDGVTVAGDLSGMAELVGEDISVGLKLADGGTGNMTFGSDSTELTWEKVDDDNITITLANDLNNEDEGESDDQSDESSVLDATYSDGELRLDMSSATSDEGKQEGEELTENISEGVMVLTADGKSDKVKVVDLAEAKAITSEDDLIGEWKLCGIGMFGLYMYGDADGIGEIFGEGSNSVVFKSGGSCTFFDAEGSYETTQDGTMLVGEEMGANVPVMAYGDDLVIDMSSFFGALFGSDAPLFMVYSK